MNTTFATFEAPGAQSQRVERAKASSQSERAEASDAQDESRSFDSVLEEKTRDAQDTTDAARAQDTPPEEQDEDVQLDAHSSLEATHEEPSSASRRGSWVAHPGIHPGASAARTRAMRARASRAPAPQGSTPADMLTRALDDIASKLGRTVGAAAATSGSAARLNAATPGGAAHASDVSDPAERGGTVGRDVTSWGREDGDLDAVARGTEEQAVQEDAGVERDRGQGDQRSKEHALGTRIAALKGAGEARAERERKLAHDPGSPEGVALAQTSAKADFIGRVQSIVRAQRAYATQRTLAASMGTTEQGGWLELELPGLEADASLRVRVVEQRAEIVVGVRAQQASPEVMRAVEEIRRILTDLGLELESVDVQTESTGGQGERGERYGRDRERRDIGGRSGSDGEGLGSEDEGHRHRRDGAVPDASPEGLAIDGIVHVVA